MFELMQWHVGLIFVVCFLSVLGILAWRNTKRQIRRTLARRENLSRSAFIEAMSGEVSAKASEFLLEMTKPHLNCFGLEIMLHPDDDFVRDLPIAEDDWSMDWPREWAERRGFHESNFPDWPKDQPVTVRNFAKWLDSAPV